MKNVKVKEGIFSRKTKPMSREMKLMSRETKPMSWEKTLMSREMKSFSRVKKSITREKKSGWERRKLSRRDAEPRKKIKIKKPLRLGVSARDWSISPNPRVLGGKREGRDSHLLK